MRPYKVIPEVMWRHDPDVEALRKLSGWADFHRVCGRHNLFFDHTERQGKRGPYRTVAFCVQNRATMLVAEGTGIRPLDAVIDAYRRSGQAVADECVAAMLAGPTPVQPESVPFDIDDILGGGFDIEDILG